MQPEIHEASPHGSSPQTRLLAASFLMLTSIIGWTFRLSGAPSDRVGDDHQDLLRQALAIAIAALVRAPTEQGQSYIRALACLSCQRTSGELIDKLSHSQELTERADLALADQPNAR